MKKILLIVGAISAFILSAVGIIKYKNETSTVCLYGVVGPSSEQIILINSKIEMYEGKIKGAELKNLIERVNTLNVRETFPTDLIINDSSNAGITLVNREYSGDNIKDSNLYEISLEYGERGFITEINVK